MKGETVMPYPPNDGQTHYAGCHTVRGHHNCAIALIDMMDAENARLARALEEARRECRALAKLAAETPQFDNPLHVYAAKQIRDRWLTPEPSCPECATSRFPHPHRCPKCGGTLWQAAPPLCQDCGEEISASPATTEGGSRG